MHALYDGVLDMPTRLCYDNVTGGIKPPHKILLDYTTILAFIQNLKNSHLLWGLINEDTGIYITSPSKLDDRINDPDSTDFDNATDINSGITYGNMINVNDKHYYKFIPTSSEQIL